MGALFSYSLASSIGLLALWTAYRWALATERQHSANRMFIYAIYAAALAMPFAGNIAEALNPVGDGATIAVGAISQHIAPDTGTTPLLPDILLQVYIAGLIITGALSIAAAVRLWRIIGRGTKIQLENGYTLVLTDDTSTVPFSWCRYMVMSRSDYESSGEPIMLHELCHLRCRHWIDLLGAQAVIILQWYNPAAWLMREELKTLHEYQADSAVIKAGTDIRQYQILLIKKAVGARFPSLANSLNHSKLKKRVTMMYKSNPSALRRLRAAALVPALALGLAVTGIPAVASALESAASASVSKGTENQPSGQTAPTANVIQGNPEIYLDGKRITSEELQAMDPSTIKGMKIDKATNIIYATTKEDGDKGGKSKVTMATFPGGETAIYRFVAQNMKYPVEAQKKKIEGRVVVKFSISATGKVSDVKVVRSVDPLLDAEAVRVVSLLPDFTPAQMDSKPVATEFALPVQFKLQ